MAFVNNTFEEIAHVIAGADDILIFTHKNMDGDAVGSSVALARAISSLGKNCRAVYDDEFPDNLRFLECDLCTTDPGIIPEPQLTVIVDANQPSRFPKTCEAFKKGRVKVCIDHHETSSNDCDYKYIDHKAAAASELVYHLINALGAEIDKEIATCIYTGITTDTGNFQYHNTTVESHEIAADLLRKGADHDLVNLEVYESVSPEKMLLKGSALAKAEFHNGGKVGITVITQEMLRETGARMSDSEGIVAELRSIRDVGIAAVIKEDNEKEISVSLRAKGEYNVLGKAIKLGGGGHAKAAGATLRMTLEEACAAVKEVLLSDDE